MRSHLKILTIAAIGVVLGGSAIAAVGPSAAIRSQTPVTRAAASTKVECERIGSAVSALIDQHRDSPNIAKARAAFQLGIMECMEDDDVAANQHYTDAKKLLAENFPAR